MTSRPPPACSDHLCARCKHGKQEYPVDAREFAIVKQHRRGDRNDQGRWEVSLHRGFRNRGGNKAEGLGQADHAAHEKLAAASGADRPKQKKQDVQMITHASSTVAAIRRSGWQKVAWLVL